MQNTEKSYFNKSIITNLIAISIVIYALTLNNEYRTPILSVGLFALSGAITNWLAIHMLFEKIPWLYGSGVIPNHFEDVKVSIRRLLMEQFFSKSNVENILLQVDVNTNTPSLDPHKLVDVIDYDHLFERLVDAIMASSFGGMLNMMGGAEALEGLRQPIITRLKESLIELASKDAFQTALRHSLISDQFSDKLLAKIETIIDNRLNELTPQLVKQMVQDMIKKHLGWLVVWGGVFGGIIGFIASYL